MSDAKQNSSDTDDDDDDDDDDNSQLDEETQSTASKHAMSDAEQNSSDADDDDDNSHLDGGKATQSTDFSASDSCNSNGEEWIKEKLDFNPLVKEGIITLHDSSTFCCELCGRFTSKNQIMRHLTKFHKICNITAVSYTHLRAHETRGNLVCRLLLEKKK